MTSNIQFFLREGLSHRAVNEPGCIQKGCMFMHKVRIRPGTLSGTVSVPPSKSAAHRAIICAALSDGVSTVSPIDLSADITATIDCMKQLGADIRLDGTVLTVDGRNLFSKPQAELDCGESGSTLRFLIPVAAAGGVNARFVGHGKLPERPIGIFTGCLPPKGVSCRTEGGLPLEISGRLQSGIYEIAGNISSQFITGLLLALPLLEGDSEIRLTTPASSVGYIHMTIAIMRDFGVNVEATETGWRICGSQRYRARAFTVEGDWSQAAFFMTAAALGGCITIDNLDPDSTQGDKACVEVYRRLGAQIHQQDGKLIMQSGDLHGITLDAGDIPDMVPAFSVAAALAKGRTVITGAQRLRIKECDRLAAMCDGLTRLGAVVQETADGLMIDGVERLRGGFAEGYNDHRIVMALAVASAGCEGDITISDMESIRKSYPGFFEDFNSLGGKSDVIMG